MDVQSPATEHGFGWLASETVADIAARLHFVLGREGDMVGGGIAMPEFSTNCIMVLGD